MRHWQDKRQEVRFWQWLPAAIAAACLTLPAAALAEDFVVRDMRVEGLQRISEGTVFNYLPINVGDTVDDTRIKEAMRALYSQQLFDDIEMRRDGDTLIIAVKERPSIEDFTIDGNKDIKTEDLMESLRGVGLARGRTFDRSVLDEVTQFLKEQYYDRGKYGVVVNTDVIDRPNNTVRVSIEVKEGERAKIRQVNIIGNRSFDEKEIRADFELDTANWLSWIRQDDRYAKEALGGDLETLRSYYMDRGYADFRVDSTQVAISPNKKDIYITINLHEGEQYKISETKIVGKMVIPEEQLSGLILARPGSTFNLQLLTQSMEMMRFRLGEQGYSIAEIEPVPELDHEKKEASVTFFVDPGSRVYVRRIIFKNIDQVDDEVLRREMRQAEGAYLSNRLVDRSKIRLQRLPYIEKVVVDNIPVPGSPDMVDVEFDIEYRMPGQFSGGLGFSESQGVILNGSIVHTQFSRLGKSCCASSEYGALFNGLQPVTYGPLHDAKRRSKNRVSQFSGYHAIYLGVIRFFDNKHWCDDRVWLSANRIPIVEFWTKFQSRRITCVEQEFATGSGLGSELRYPVHRTGQSRRFFHRHRI